MAGEGAWTAPHTSQHLYRLHDAQKRVQANEGRKKKFVNLVKKWERERRGGEILDSEKTMQEKDKGFGFDFLWFLNHSSSKRRACSDASKGLCRGSRFVSKESQAINVRLLDLLGVPGGHGQEEHGQGYRIFLQGKQEMEICVSFMGRERDEESKETRTAGEPMEWDTLAAFC